MNIYYQLFNADNVNMHDNVHYTLSGHIGNAVASYEESWFPPQAEPICTVKVDLKGYCNVLGGV